MLSSSSIQFADGRQPDIHQLTQHAIYANVLEGVPNRFVNQRIVEDALAAARRMGEPCHLLPPKITALRPGDDRGQWTLERLPRVCCIAKLVSGPTHPEHDDDWRSELTVLWFQDSYALPLDADARAALAQLDWRSLARDVCFR